MGISCRSIGKMRGIMDKMKREQVLEAEKVKLEKKSKKKNTETKGE